MAANGTKPMLSWRPQPAKKANAKKPLSLIMIRRVVKTVRREVPARGLFYMVGLEEALGWSKTFSNWGDIGGSGACQRPKAAKVCLRK